MMPIRGHRGGVDEGSEKKYTTQRVCIEQIGTLAFATGAVTIVLKELEDHETHLSAK
jgi:hypothetical protein